MSGALNPYVSQWISETNRSFPGRSKASDGTWGDASHRARKSDHNTGDAVDITNDPSSGAGGDVIANRAIRDPRVKYVIWNHQIYNRSRPGWRPYHGSNPHTHHVHISFLRAARASVSPKAGAPTGRRRRRRRRGSLHSRVHAKHARSKGSGGGGKNKGGGKKLITGENSVMLGSGYRMTAHVESLHEGGGKVVKGSPSVYVGEKRLAMARLTDPTNDKLNVKTAIEDIWVG